MRSKTLIYRHNDKDYTVIITYKKMKYIRYTYKDGVFKVSAPIVFTNEKDIFKGLDKYADRLIKADVRTFAKGDDYFYLLGVKLPLKNEGKIDFTNGESIEYKSQEDLDKKLKKWFLNYITLRHRYYEKVMEIKKPYKVKVRKMTTRYGSNSSASRSVTYSMVLIHYTSDVIDSVIVHELAHDKVRNHSKKFYDVVYKYCPNYKELHRRLRKGEFQ